MEKRALLAFILTFAVLILWPYLFQPNREKPPEVEQPGEIGQETLPEEEWVPPYLEKEEEKGQGISLPIKEDVEREMIVENSLYRIKFSNRGGVVTSWRLKEHMNESGDALNLISSAAKELNFYPLQLKTGDEELDYRLSHGLYEMSLERATITEDSGQKVEGQKITFRYADGKGLFVEKVLEIPDGRYLSYIRFSIKGSGIEGSPSL
ncbi:MAG: membrane protein insertase YidC, partial [Candidatus Aminicenantales bacterium]